MRKRIEGRKDKSWHLRPLRFHDIMFYMKNIDIMKPYIFYMTGAGEMSEALMLPVGIENFREIRENGFYYIDKTKLIEQLLEQ